VDAGAAAGRRRSAASCASAGCAPAPGARLWWSSSRGTAEVTSRLLGAWPDRESRMEIGQRPDGFLERRGLVAAIPAFHQGISIRSSIPAAAAPRLHHRQRARSSVFIVSGSASGSFTVLSRTSVRTADAHRDQGGKEKRRMALSSDSGTPGSRAGRAEIARRMVLSGSFRVDGRLP